MQINMKNNTVSVQDDGLKSTFYQRIFCGTNRKQLVFRCGASAFIRYMDNTFPQIFPQILLSNLLWTAPSLDQSTWVLSALASCNLGRNGAPARDVPAPVPLNHGCSLALAWVTGEQTTFPHCTPWESTTVFSLLFDRVHWPALWAALFEQGGPEHWILGFLGFTTGCTTDNMVKLSVTSVRVTMLF